MTWKADLTNDATRNYSQMVMISNNMNHVLSIAPNDDGELVLRVEGRAGGPSADVPLEWLHEVMTRALAEKSAFVRSLRDADERWRRCGRRPPKTSTSTSDR
jgi:hypothetical protein